MCFGEAVEIREGRSENSKAVVEVEVRTRLREKAKLFVKVV